jgi:transglutaminase-like putative cysteine protease
MLRPRSGESQWLVSERYALKPWVRASEVMDPYGNLVQRFTVPAGGMHIDVEVVVETDEGLAVPEQNRPPTAIEHLPDDVLTYLLPSRYCPSDKLAERAAQIVEGLAPGYAQVEGIRRWIHDTLVYEYGVSDATTDALDTLALGKGVCRDFSHVAIALTRALQIPARQVVGYLHQLDPMDMHAWFEAFIDGRWYTFDPTQDRPKGGRIVVGYGHDATDVAFISNYGPLQITAMTVEVVRLPDA